MEKIKLLSLLWVESCRNSTKLFNDCFDL